MDSDGHILTVEQYIRMIYGNVKMSVGYIDTMFDAPAGSLDQMVLWQTFHDIAYREIFARSSGEVSMFSDYDQAVMLQTAIAQQWPRAYYLDKLVSAGIVHKFETEKDVFTFAVKEAYSPILHTILTEVDISEDS